MPLLECVNAFINYEKYQVVPTRFKYRNNASKRTPYSKRPGALFFNENEQNPE